MNFEARPFTEAEEDVEFGTRTKAVGTAYKLNDGYYDHFYLQRENDVLHVNNGGMVINRLHVGFLNQATGLKKITVVEFNDIMRKTIYDLEIGNYWVAQ